MKHKPLHIKTLEGCNAFIKDLRIEVKEFNDKYRGQLVSLHNPQGKTTDGYLNHVRLSFFDDTIHITFNVSPLHTYNDGKSAFVSAHNDDFYDADSIKIVNNWKKIRNTSI